MLAKINKESQQQMQFFNSGSSNSLNNPSSLNSFPPNPFYNPSPTQQQMLL
jgi:hypothetical protein